MRTLSVNKIAGVAAFAGLALLIGVTVVSTGEALPGDVDDFRSWVHVKSTVVVDRNSALYGFHNVYANAIALPTLKEGGRFREGAALAVSFHELETKDGGTAQGKRIKVGFMSKDNSAGNTGGWRYYIIGPDGKPKTIDPVKGCHECHSKAGNTDCVFSKYVE